jgi:hypothetical protein
MGVTATNDDQERVTAKTPALWHHWRLTTKSSHSAQGEALSYEDARFNHNSCTKTSDWLGKILHTGTPSLIVSYLFTFLLFWAPLCLVVGAKKYFFCALYKNSDDSQKRRQIENGKWQRQK